MLDSLHVQLYAALREMRDRYMACTPVVNQFSCEFAGRTDNVPANHRCKACILHDAHEALLDYEARS